MNHALNSGPIQELTRPPELLFRSSEVSRRNRFPHLATLRAQGFFYGTIVRPPLDVLSQTFFGTFCVWHNRTTLSNCLNEPNPFAHQAGQTPF